MSASSSKLSFSFNATLQFSFAREDEGSPRMDILAQFCPEQLGEFKICMAANAGDENKCLDTKGILEKCSGVAFSTVNAAGAGKWVF